MKVRTRSDYREKQRRRNSHRERKYVYSDVKETFIPRSDDDRLPVSWFHPLLVKLSKKTKYKHEHTLKEKLVILKKQQNDNS